MTDKLPQLTDKRLDELSDKVRRGELVDFLEALAVINYQNRLKKAREYRSVKARFKRLLSAIRGTKGAP